MEGSAIVVLLLLGSCASSSSRVPVTELEYFGRENWEKGIKCPLLAEDGSPVILRALEFEGSWAVGLWDKLREPSLHFLANNPSATPLRAYRFTWMPAFHTPAVIRIEEEPDGSFLLTATRGRSHVDRKLRPDEMARTLAVLSASSAMGLPITDGVGCDIVIDGSGWIFEGVEDARYHVAVDFMPVGDEPMRLIGEAFLKLTGWSVNPLY